MTRILVVHNAYLQRGGEDISVAMEIAALRRRGHVVELLEARNDELTTGGSAQVRRTATAVTWRHDNARRTGAVLDRFRPDWIYANNLFPSLGAAAYVTLRRAGVPLAMVLRNYRRYCLSANLFRDGHPCTDCASGHRALPGVRHGCYRGSVGASVGVLTFNVAQHVGERAVGRPDVFLVLSDGMRQLVAGREGRTPVLIKPNIVQAGEWSPVSYEFDIAWLGRLEDEKGWAVFREIVERRPDLRALIIGDGTRREGAATLSALGQVTWFQDLDHGETLAALRRARTLVAVSIWQEPFGRTVAEAMSLGVVPIVSPLSSFATLLAELTGISLTAGTAEEVAAAVDRVGLLPAADHRQIARRLVQHAASNFSEDAVVSSIEAAFAAVQNDASSP